MLVTITYHMLCMLSSVFVQGVRAAYESEIDLLKTSLRDEKALNTETARKHKIELEELKKDIAEKVLPQSQCVFML